MTGRTLTAGTPRADSSPPLPAKYQPDVENYVWHMLDQLWRLGERWAAVGPEQQRLYALTVRMCDWLQAHEDHPEFAERQARYHALWLKERVLKSRVNAIEREAESLIANLEKHLGRLRPRRLAELRALGNWPEDPVDRLAAVLWDQAKRRGPFPKGERF